MRWEVEELEAVVDQWLAAFVERGLLKVDGNHYVRPAPSSRQFVLLTLLARVVVQTLQRFYMATSLLLNSGQHSLSAEELENLCTVMAQRLSILHGLNAPEFFDKALFRHFIQSMQEQGVVSPDENGRLGYHEKLAELAEGAAKRVLPAEIRLSIRQVALERHHDESDSPPPATDAYDAARSSPARVAGVRVQLLACDSEAVATVEGDTGAVGGINGQAQPLAQALGVLEQRRADAMALLRWRHEDSGQDVIEQRHETDHRAIPLVDPGLRSGQIEVAHVIQPRLPEAALDKIMGTAGGLEPDAQQRFQVIGAVRADHVRLSKTAKGRTVAHRRRDVAPPVIH